MSFRRYRILPRLNGVGYLSTALIADVPGQFVTDVPGSNRDRRGLHSHVAKAFTFFYCDQAMGYFSNKHSQGDNFDADIGFGCFELVSNLLFFPIKVIAVFGLPVYWVVIVDRGINADVFLLASLVTCSVSILFFVILSIIFYGHGAVKKVMDTPDRAPVKKSSFLLGYMTALNLIAIGAGVASIIRAYFHYWHTN